MSANIDIKTKAITRQINSPHAKYNSRGKLMCIVCGTEVKSAIIWKAHVQKRSHLENLTRLTEKQKQLNSVHKTAVKSKPKPSPKKRPIETPQPSGKKFKTTKELLQQKPAKGILKNLASYSSDSEEDVKPPLPLSVPPDPNLIDQKPDVKPPNGIPDNFFDSGDVSKAIKTETESYEREPSPEPTAPPKPNTSEVLPEGFFDDPVADAKARNVEYKDKEAEEWNIFMKEVSAAEIESRQIIAEDKEEAALENQLEEANEQINHLQKVVDLDKKKKDVLQELNNRTTESDDSSSDEEFCPVIWRTKNSRL